MVFFLLFVLVKCGVVFVPHLLIGFVLLVTVSSGVLCLPSCHLSSFGGVKWLPSLNMFFPE